MISGFFFCWTWNCYEILPFFLRQIKKKSCLAIIVSFLGFKIFVGWIFVSIDLHVGYVPFLRRYSLIYLNETLKMQTNQIKLRFKNMLMINYEPVGEESEHVASSVRRDRPPWQPKEPLQQKPGWSKRNGSRDDRIHGGQRNPMTSAKTWNIKRDE